MQFKILSIVVALFWFFPCSSQSFESYINAYADQNKEGYLQPFADLSISGLNAGVPQSAYIKDQFYLSLSFAGMYEKPSSSMKTFTGSTGDSFTESLTAEAPTIIGENESVLVTASDGTSYVFAPGYNLSFLAWVTPQLTLGGIYGSEISGRFLTYDSGGDFGKFRQLGVGIRHSIDQYINEFPIALNVGYQFNNAEIGRYMKLKSHFAYVQGGYTVGLLDLLAYAGYQTGDLDINYEYYGNSAPEEVEVFLKNENALLAGISAKVQLGFFSIAAGLAGPKPFIATSTIGFRFGKNSDKEKEPIQESEDEIIKEDIN